MDQRERRGLVSQLLETVVGRVVQLGLGRKPLG